MPPTCPSAPFPAAWRRRTPTEAHRATAGPPPHGEPGAPQSRVAAGLPAVPLHPKATSSSSSPLPRRGTKDCGNEVSEHLLRSGLGGGFRHRVPRQRRWPRYARVALGPKNVVTDGRGTTEGKQWSVCSHRVDGWGSLAHFNRSLPRQPAGTLGQHRTPQHSAQGLRLPALLREGPVVRVLLAHSVSFSKRPPPSSSCSTTSTAQASTPSHTLHLSGT